MSECASVKVIMFHCSAIVCLFDSGPHVSLVSSSPNWFLVTFLQDETLHTFVCASVAESDFWPLKLIKKFVHVCTQAVLSNQWALQT